jgi:DNA-binding NarL/FixJ family response regulator
VKAASNRIRILSGEMPRMLREIVEDAVRSQPDMELVDSSDGHDLPMAIKREHADVLIVAEHRADEPVSHEQLLLENPRLKILVVSRDGREAHLLEFWRVPVAEVSLQGLVGAIRAAVGSGTS